MKTIFITGASSGFGEATARKFSSEGHRLILLARRREKLIDLTHQLGGENKCHLISADVRDKEEVENALSSLPEEFRSIDVLVNNAGLALGLGPAEDASLKDWEIMVDTNIKGVIYLTKAVLPGMIRRGRGQIINIGSVAGSWPYPGGNVYGGTKAFVQQFSRNLRSDLSGKNIRVSLVEPGMSETEFSLTRFEGDQDKAKAVYHSMKPLSADDIAETVFWICSMPAHVNVNQIELMPIAQAWAPFSVYRD
ncbi:MAG: SDR family oxidoreductase [Candidatus Azotimanducaceae bacterium]